ncbi:MAG: methyltransferase domain-containing protein [Bacteroidetes bacterium]|nr:methyltransferase domain-containing protein [Bacteroidota bacterium]
MKTPHKSSLLSAVACFMLLLQSCSSPQKIARRYTNNDSTSIFSTHKSRPFKYGFAFNKTDATDYYEQNLEAYHLRNGQTIADVGAASGWHEGILSLMFDSMHFYVEDIDTNLLNRDQLNRVVKYYSGLRSTPQTNTFEMVLGDKKHSNLPDSIFDKVVVNSTFHEMMNPWRMVSDIGHKLKPDGQLIISDDFSNSYMRRYVRGCGTLAFKYRDAIDIMELYDFYLVDMTEPANSFQNILTFERNKEKAEEFSDRRQKVAPYIEELDKLYQEDVATDSAKIKHIAMILKMNLQDIHGVYATLENYLRELAMQWSEDEKPEAAKGVFTVGLELYPHSAQLYQYLSYVYADCHQFDKALIYYGYALDNKLKNASVKDDILDALDALSLLK